MPALSKLTDDMVEEIYNLKQQCMSNKEIAKVFGINQSTIYDWLDEQGPRFQSAFSKRYNSDITESKIALKGSLL